MGKLVLYIPKRLAEELEEQGFSPPDQRRIALAALAETIDRSQSSGFQTWTPEFVADEPDLSVKTVRERHAAEARYAAEKAERLRSSEKAAEIREMLARRFGP